MLEDVICPGLKLLVCGTAVGHKTAAGNYYAGPGNRFWRTLQDCGLTPTLIKPEDWGTLPGFGIGLTDLAKRHQGMDHKLPKSAYDQDRLNNLVLRNCPTILAFNGKRASESFTGPEMSLMAGIRTA